MLGDAEGEAQIAQLGLGRRAFGDDLELHVIDDRVVARLHQEPAGHRLERETGRARIGQAAGDEQPQVLLGGDDGDRLLARGRRDDHLGEDFGDRFGRFRVEFAVERDDAAEGRDVESQASARR